MRVFSTILAALALVFGALAADEFESVIVTFPPGTAAGDMAAARQKFEEQGGKITHVYGLINGFSGKYPLTLTQSVNAWKDQYHATIEKDQVVSAIDSGSS